MVADERGQLRAGRILEWMDVVGVLAATRHCRAPVVTVSVDGMDLREPVRLGERVSMRAAVGFTSDKSIGISVSMVAGFQEGHERRCFDGYMTFVALDEAGRYVRLLAATGGSPDSMKLSALLTALRNFGSPASPR